MEKFMGKTNISVKPARTKADSDITENSPPNAPAIATLPIIGNGSGDRVFLYSFRESPV